MGSDVTRRQVLAAGAAVAGSAALAATPLGEAAAATAQAGRHGPKPTIVLVHGGYADSSCWNGVIPKLQRDGFTCDRGVEPAAGHPHRRPVHRESAGLHHRAGRAGRPLDGRNRHHERCCREEQRQGVGLHRCVRPRRG